jgi:hypothetical protein
MSYICGHIVVLKHVKTGALVKHQSNPPGIVPLLFLCFLFIINLFTCSIPIVKQCTTQYTKMTKGGQMIVPQFRQQI